MTQNSPTPDDDCRGPTASRWRFVFGVSKTWLAAILGPVCVAIGAVIWHHQSVECSFRTALAAIPSGDIPVLSRAARSFPAGSPRAQLLLGAIDLKSNNPAAALRKLQAAANDPETALWAHFLAGEALCRLQQYEAAIKTLRGALEQDPDNIDAHRWLAVAAYDIGAAADAVEEMQHVIRLAPRDPRAYRMLGLIFTEAEEFPKAITAYQTSLRCSRDQSDVEQILAALAAAQLRVHRYEDVLATLQNAPSTPELDGLRAESLYAVGRGPEARRMIETVLQTANTSRALILKGLILLDDGRAAEAIEPLLQAVQLQPEDFETRAKLTQAYAQSGDAAGAKRELKEFERIKSIRQQIHELTLQAAQQPAVADFRYQLGLQYRELGLLQAAGKWFRAAYALDPTHTAARKAFSEIMEATAISDRK